MESWHLAVSVSASATAERQTFGMEAAPVLDVTGSMKGNSIAALRTVASDLINILYGPNRTIPNLWVSVTPYTTTVNLGPTRTNWLNATPDEGRYGDKGWRGCVEARHENDARSGKARFVPWLWISTLAATAIAALW